MRLPVTQASRGMACAFLLVACVFRVETVAQSQAALMHRIYNVLGTQSFSTAGEFIVLSPGFALDTWLDSDPRTNFDISRLFDRTLGRDWIAKPTDKTVAEVYRQVLGAEWAVHALSASQKAELSRINTELYLDPKARVPAAGYRKYLELKTAYEDLARAQDQLPEDQRTAEIRNGVTEAEENLQLKGNPRLYGPLEDRLAVLDAASPRQWAADLLEDLDANTVTIGQTRFEPAPSATSVQEALAASDWTHIRATVSLNDNAGAVAHSLPQEWGLWRFDDGRYSSATWSPSGVNQITLAFDARLIEIERPWFNEAVLTSRAWRWPAGHPMLSGGTEPSPGELLPILPTHGLLVKHLEVTGNFPPAEMRALRSRIAARLPSAFGPFATSGFHLNNPDRRFFAARRLRNGFAVDEVQFVGWYSRGVSKAPNPDPALSWK